ncbi:unnamed protein product [Musa acuminata subsp. malaccensis]|uniref:(wild Malaysian banana) hypothetical protein n=1 Tax=Musa acuminata subsp. malaccensis TaxID=214687 RepID=A0A8D7APZ1_MUSAM|nr:unnamed protein product [Musa acuminata subsp. malaccensis]
MGGLSSSTQRLVVITVGLLAVLSPLYVGRRGRVEPDDDGGGGALSLWLLLLLLVFVINLTCCADRRIMRFDPYWIHRFGGSSCGIIVLLLVLGVVLRCKASLGG